MKKHEHGSGHHRGRSHDRRVDHRDRSAERRHHHDHRKVEDGHHRHDHERLGEHRHRRERSGEQHRKHRSRERLRDRCKGKGNDRGISVDEGSPNDDSGHMMTGGAGPAGTLPQDTPSEPRGLLYSRSRSRSGRRARDNTPEQGRARAPPSPTRRIGPDGRTPFGQLPNRRGGVGLKDHFLDTYEHIKAEHEQGFRAQTVVEQAVDAFLGKSAGKHLRDVNDIRNRDRRGDGHRRQGKEKSRGGRERKRKHKEGAEHRHNRLRQDDLSDHRDGKPPTPYHLSSGSPRKYHADAAHVSPVANRSSILAHGYGQQYSQSPSPPALRVQDATPPSPPSDPGRAWTPTPTRLEPRSSTGGGAAAESYNSLQTGRMSPDRPPSMSQNIPPPPPGTPPISGPRHGMIPDQAALFGEIQAGKKLRKVSSSEKRYKSQRASLDRASNNIIGLSYHETSHSREVEDRERGQASNRTWTDAGDGDDGSERLRAFKQGLAAKLGRAFPQVPRTSIGNEELTPGARSQTSVKTDIIAVEDLTLQQVD
ncbi:hypothetical protein BKA63DRAFT_469368 [Paraphoma chrysanthemicola]|nr:hypothetical protein BKA63DRAFT_469368 [Paraphoma chrysanthemicola]